MPNSAKPAGPSLSAAKIRDFEKKVGRSLPAEFKALLLKQNGGPLERCTFDFAAPKGQDGSDVLQGFYGIGARVKTSDLGYALKTYRERVPQRMLPIAHTVFGNLVCLSCSGKDKGQIFFWDHEAEADDDEPAREDNLYRAAKSLGEFTKNLYELPVPDWEEACQSGDAEGVQRWLDEKRRSKKELNDAARLAAIHGQGGVVKLLLEGGANTTNLIGIAAQNKRLGLVKQLLAAKVKIADGDLLCAAGGGDARIVKLFLELGADVNEGPSKRWSPLMAAAQAGSLSVVKLLLAHGAEPLITDEFGQGPAMRARYVAAWKVVSLLEKAAETAAQRRRKR